MKFYIGVLFLFILFIIISCETNNNTNQFVEYNQTSADSIEKYLQIKLDTNCKLIYFKKEIMSSEEEWIYFNNMLIRIDNCLTIKEKIISKFSLKKINAANLRLNTSVFWDTIIDKPIIKPSPFCDSSLWNIYPDRELKNPKWWKPKENINRNYANYIYFKNDTIQSSSIDSIFNGRIVLHIENKILFIFIEIGKTFNNSKNNQN